MDERSPALKASSGAVRFLDYLFFLRPMLHPPVWTIVILGYFNRINEPAPVSRLILLLAVSSTAAGWAYVINQISDIESDRINNKLYFLPLGIITIKTAYTMAAIMCALTLIGGFFLGPTIAILFAVGLGLGYLYSGKPFYLKNRPLASAMSNGIAHGILPFLAGYVACGGQIFDGLKLSIPYLFAVVAVFIGTTIPDIEGDSNSGKITSGVALGSRLGSFVMTVSLSVSLIIGYLVRDWAVVIAAAISLPFYLLAIKKQTERWTITAIKMSILLLSIAACFRFWQYAILLIVLFTATRLYYKKRFGMAYPGLT